MREEKIKPEIERLDLHAKWALLIVSALTLAALVWAALIENVFPEWRRYRLEYARILEEKATDERGRAIAEQFEIGIDQNVVPALGVIDRCITCHTGLDDPRMTDQPLPFRTHPGALLRDHPPEQFGCTICHEGQGRATETNDAHGFDPHWLHPMHSAENRYASCSECHGRDALLDEDLRTMMRAPEAGRGLALMARGKQLLETNGCLGCHKLDGRGGALGPDITYVGDKLRHDFDFSHFAPDEPRDVAYWLRKHFLEPQEISPGTVMPDLGFSAEDADALTAYVLSFKSLTTVLAYSDGSRTDRVPQAAASGEALYKMMCSACHGSAGEESEVPGIRTPALNNVDSLASASDDYLRHIIYTGRSNTNMPGWNADSGNLRQDEIDALVRYIRRWEPAGPTLAQVRAAAGDPAMGAAYFRGMCSNCHGDAGEGGIGNALNALTFLSIASDDFLAATIISGRPGTAMASWKHLPAQAVSDLVAYIRTWQPAAPTFEAVQASRKREPAAENVRVGEILFKGNCATCHGRDGEGGIGPRLNSVNILPAVDDLYLYKTITGGRPTTAMPAWRHLSADRIGAIIDYMRSWNGGERKTLPKAPPRGDYELGALHFNTSCVECHGDDARGGVGPQLANPVFLDSVSDDTLHYWIAHGRTGTAMKGFAPEEQGPTRLARDQIGDVIAYLRHEGSKFERPIRRTGVGNPTLGRQLFAGSCAGCHGSDGEGASGPQLHNASFLRNASDGFLAATIVLGRTGTPMQSMIHGQEGLGQIEPDQVQDLIAYMRLWDYAETWGKPRSLAEISERAIRSGEQKFAHYCSGCHGPNGRGVADGDSFFAPALNNPEFLDAASDGFLLATIARGRSRTPMRPFGDGAGGIAALDTEAISDIVSYIRTWQEAYAPKGD